MEESRRDVQRVGGAFFWGGGEKTVSVCDMFYS